MAARSSDCACTAVTESERPSCTVGGHLLTDAAGSNSYLCGMLRPLPFSTFREIVAFQLKAHVYCSRCYALRRIDPSASHVRNRCFAGTRFHCTEYRMLKAAIANYKVGKRPTD